MNPVLLRLRRAALALIVLSGVGQALTVLPATAAKPSHQPDVVVGRSVRNDTSPSLSTLRPSPLPVDGKGRPDRPLKRPNSGPKVSTAPSSVQSSPIGSAMPSTSTNFEGVNNLDNVLPPDTNGDVGPNHYVQWVNLHFQVFDRMGNSVLGPSPGNTLWSGFGGNCEFTNRGDPVVRHDRMADRWVFTQFAFTIQNGMPAAPFSQCFAVSATADPTGSYNRYEFLISNTYFNDYPKLGVWPDAYYMSVNYFNNNTFAGGGALAFDRNSMLAGQPAAMVSFGPLGPAYGGMLPSDLDGALLPPTGSPNYFGAVDTSAAPSGSTFQIWKFHVDWVTPANSTFGTTTHTPNFNLAVASYRWLLCGGSRNCIPQPGTSVGVDPLSDRLMNRLQYRNFADGHESLVANHTVAIGSGNQAGIRWYELRGLSGTPVVYQQGTYAPSGDNRWMGSVAMDQSGDIALGYSVSSGSVYPSVRYTGRLFTDPLSSLPQGEATVVAGQGSQTSSFYRWGDYSMMAVDPVDDCTFWYTQEYYTVTSTAGWHTRVGSFKFPSCGTTPPWAAAYSVGNTPTTWTANQTQTYSVTLTNTGSQTWPSGGSAPVRLGVHFATRGGGYPPNYSAWLTDQRFFLPADVAPGTSVTLSIAVTAPGAGGTDVLEYQMVKETQFWFAQYADVSVTVQGTTPSWGASYDTSNTPTSWNVNQTQTYSVTLTNTGNQTWPAGGGNPVHLGVHFATRGGGYPASRPWLTDQRFTLAADVPAGASVTLSIAVTAPGSGGNDIVEYEMVKENQFWFTQFADVAVTVQGAAPTWSASYDVSSTPTAWTANQTQTYAVTITNTGNQTWPAGGTNPVHLGVHFATRGGGFRNNYPWLTDQRFILPADLAPGAAVTLTISVTAPANPGSVVLEYQMVKEYQFWFGQFADVNVVVA